MLIYLDVISLILAQICERAESEIFSRISTHAVPTAEYHTGEMEALLAIVGAGSSGIPNYGTPLVIIQVTKIFERMLDDAQAMSNVTL